MSRRILLFCALSAASISAVLVRPAIASVNNPPVLNFPSVIQADEDTPFNFVGVNLLSIVSADPNSTDISVQVQVDNGSLQVLNPPSLLSCNANPPAGTFCFNNDDDRNANDANYDRLTIYKGSLALVNQALSSMQYRPDPNITGQDNLHLFVTDQIPNNLGSKTVDIPFTVAAVNDAPVNSVPGPQSVAVGTALDLSGSMTVKDDAAAGDQIQTTVSIDGGPGTFTTFVNGSLSGNNTGTVVLTGTPFQVNQSLNNFVFQDNGPSGSGGTPYTVTMATDDLGSTGKGGPLTDVKTFTINVTGGNPAAANLAPVNTVPTPQIVVVGSTLALTGAAAISVTDADADNAQIKTTVSVGAGKGTFTAQSSGGELTTGSGTALLTFLGKQTDITQALATLVYTPPVQAGGPHIVTVTTDDLGHFGTGGPKTDSNTFTITVQNAASANMPPKNTVPGSQVVALNSTLKLLAPNVISIADPDAGNAPMQTTVSVGVGEGTFTALSIGSEVTTGSGANSLTLSGNQTEINQALLTISYIPSAPSGVLHTVTVQTDDLGNTGTGGPLTDTDTFTITVQAAPISNLAPVNGVPGAQAVPTNNPLVFSSVNGNALSTVDPDAGVAPIQVTVGVPVGTGTLTYNVPIAPVTATGTGTASVTLTGPQLAVVAALDGLTLHPLISTGLSTTLTMTTDDQGNTGFGGKKTDTDTVLITIVGPINTVPIGPIHVVNTSALTFTKGTATELSVSAPDAGANAIHVVFSTTQGTVHVNALPGGAIVGNDSAHVVLDGTTVSINTALHGAIYVPLSGFVGPDTLVIFTSDLKNNPSAVAATDQDTLALIIDAAPVPATTTTTTTTPTIATTTSTTTTTLLPTAVVPPGPVSNPATTAPPPAPQPSTSPATTTSPVSTTVPATVAKTIAAAAPSKPATSSTAPGSKPDETVLINLDPDQVTVEVEGSGYQPNSTVWFVFHSTAITAGTAKVDRKGSFIATVTIPRALKPGVHELEVRGVKASGAISSARTSFVLETTFANARPTNELAVTGNNVGVMLELGIILLISGTLIVGRVCRRRFSHL